MKFFEVIPGELFSPLASPTRVLYADALDVLYNAYRENLKIPEDMLYSMLRRRQRRKQFARYYFKKLHQISSCRRQL